MKSEDLIEYTEIVLRFLEPLIQAAEDAEYAELLLAELGYVPPSEVTAFDDLAIGMESIVDLIDEVEQYCDDGSNAEEILPLLVEILVNIGSLLKNVSNFSSNIQENYSGSDFLQQTDILDAIGRKLIDYLFVSYFENNQPAAYGLLLFIGIFEKEEVQDIPTEFEGSYTKRSVHWDKIGSVLTDPVGTIKSSFANGNEIKYDKLISQLNELGVSLGLFTDYYAPSLDALEAFNNGNELSGVESFNELTVLRLPLLNSPSIDLALEVYPIVKPVDGKYIGLGIGMSFGGELEITINDSLKLIIELSTNLSNSLGVTLDYDGNFGFINNVFTDSPSNLSDSTELAAMISIVAKDKSTQGKLLTFGAPDGSRFEIGSGSLTFGIEKTQSTNFKIEGDLKDGLVVLKTGDADGFISKLLPGDGIEADFNFGIGFSNDNGIYFKGSAGLEIQLPIHISLGPIEIRSLTLGIGFKGEKIPITVAGGFSANLGPLTAVVEELGVKADLKFVSDRSGNLGPIDLDFGFKPPKGVGLAIDAAVIKGGGYLYFDFDREEYAGALELTFSEFLSLKAIGMVTTRMPDGSKGFSLLIIITAEFGAGIQLGFGFSLLGVGGLLGLNRTMLLQPLIEGVRAGAVNHIMFPTNVVENAPQIISDLRTIFPPEEGKFLIGPMAKLGWGAPPLISLSLGIVIEIPGNIAILGVLKAALPTEDETLILLQVSFAGAIEFDKKRLYFFASLFGSRILYITLDGDMGLLMAWGRDPNFVLSVGGFHPRFRPPPLPFPNPNRLALSILNEPGARLRVMAYFAVTSNTVQFGARAELFFDFSELQVSGHIAFDALIQFSPFYFIFQISASVSLKVFGMGLFSIRLRLALEGPAPWRAKGSGSLTLLFFEIEADFDVTWGEARDTSLPSVEVMPLLIDEFGKRENWTTELPAANNLLVSLQKIEIGKDDLVSHPIGIFRSSQRAVPLDITINKVGNQKVKDANKFWIEVVPDTPDDPKVPGNLSVTDVAEENFAIAQFQDMDDSRKLSRPAFQLEHGGVKLSVVGLQSKSSKMVKRIVRYELVIIDTNFKRFPQKFFEFWKGLYAHFLGDNAATNSPLSAKTKRQQQPFDDKVTIEADSYAVAFNSNNQAVAEEASAFSSEALAREYMLEQFASNPNLEGQVHVIPQPELSEAA